MCFFTTLFLGLAFGKPPTLLRNFIDCEINPDQPVKLPDGQTRHGGNPLSFWRDLVLCSESLSDRYRIELMTSTILPEIAEFVLSSSKHKYSEVILMDRKLRDCAEDVFGSPAGSLQVSHVLCRGIIFHCFKVTVDDLRHATRAGVMRNFYILSAKETRQSPC